MSLSRTCVRAYALVRASLALFAGSGAFLSAGVLPLALIISQPVAPKKEAKPVAIHILVIEGDKKGKEVDKRIDAALKSAMPGYTGAKVLDELTTSVEEGSSVSLEILRKSGESRLLKVTVRSVDPNGTVHLNVAIEALKFSADTTHEKSGRLVVRHPLSEDKALFLAVTPKL